MVDFIFDFNPKTSLKRYNEKRFDCDKEIFYCIRFNLFVVFVFKPFICEVNRVPYERNG